MKKQEVTNLIKETIENKLFEHKFKQEISEIYDSRQDLQSVMLVSMMEELSGKKIPDPTVLDEGVWEKAKAMLAKIRLSKSTGASQQRDALEAAADKAANKKFSEMLAQLKQAPGFDKYPNNEKEEEFVGITTGLGIIYQSVVEAHKDGLIETDTANDLVSKLKSYVDGLEGDLSYSYRYFNEDEDADGDDVLEEEEEELNERVSTNYNKITKFLELMDGGKAKPFQARKVKRVYQSLEKEFKRRGNSFEGMTNKERDLLKMLRKEKGVLDAYTAKGDFQPEVDFFKDRGGDAGGAQGGGGQGGGGGDAPANPDADLDPSDPDSFGNYSDDGDRGFADSSPLNPMSQQKFTGVGDIGGVQDLGKLYRQAGSVSTLSSWLVPGFLKSFAGFSLPVAGIAGITALVAKRLMGKSREGSLKKLSGVLAPVDPGDQGTETPKPPTGGDDSQLPDPPEVQPQVGPDGREDDPAQDPPAGPAGAPVVKSVSSNNLATRDADGTSTDASGETVFDKPSALALAKAQVQWLTANPGNTPALKNGRAKMKRDLEDAIARTAKTRMQGDIPDDRDDTISDDEITKGVSSTPDFGGLAETVNRWQKIAGIIKG